MTGPQRTVAEVAAPYDNYLVPVPAKGADVCPVCHSMVSGYPMCWQCNEARKVLGDRTADVTAFVSLAPRDEQFAYELFTYKNANAPPSARQRITIGLAAVLWNWLDHHETCLTRSLGVASFDLITTVPSTSGRTTHPLRELVAGTVEGTEQNYADLLAVSRTDLKQREHAADRYKATRRLGSQSILVIDDTWTTGAHAQSASAALKTAGAAGVAILTIGRWFNPDFVASGNIHGASWLTKQRRQGWDWQRCCLDPA